MSNHGANNNENRKHVLNRCQGFVFISNRIWRGGRKWQHRSSHFVINPCPEFRKYLQSVTCVCLRKMMLLQQPQQSLPDHWADSNRSPWLRCNETLWLWKEGDDAKPGGEKKGEKKSRGRVGRWRQIQVWVRIPWIVLFMSASLFNENQKDFSWGNIQQNGVRNEWAEGGEKKFVIFIFIFFYVDCVGMLSSSFEKLSWQVSVRKKDKKVPLVMCAAARFLKLAWTAADVLINYESIQRPRIFLFLKKKSECHVKIYLPANIKKRKKKRRHKFLDLTWQWPLFLLIVIFLSRGGNAGFSFLVVIKTVFPLSPFRPSKTHPRTEAGKVPEAETWGARFAEVEHV